MRLIMRKIIERAQGYELVGEAENGEELLALFDEKRPQVLILDVEMPGLSGVQCAKAVQDRAPLTVIIFATAHERYMGDAFELYAFDYLLKPFKVERVLKTLELVKSRLGALLEGEAKPLRQVPARPCARRLMLKHREGISFVDMDELLLVQREERSTVLYMEDGERFVTGDSLGEMEDRLPKEIFFRCHKSYIINMNRIASISPYGRWTYVVKLRGIKQDALITHERFEALQGMFS